MLKIVLGIALIGVTQTGWSSTLCAENEKVLFSCRTAQKILSLCSSSDLSKTAGYIQYRFGRIGHLEMVYPRTKIHPSNLFSVAWNVGSGGGYEASTSFRIGEFKYKVYSVQVLGSIDDMNKSKPGDYGPRSGVLVEKGLNGLKDIRCEDEANNDDPRQFIEKLPDFLRDE